MSLIKSVQKDYESLNQTMKSKLCLPHFKPVNWTFLVSNYQDVESLNKALKELNLDSGWLTLPSKNCLIDEYQYDGSPLEGQACNSELSIQISFTGCEWKIVQIQAKESEQSINGLVCEDKHLFKLDETKHLYFESFWQEVDGAIRKTASRFIGVK